MAPRSPRSSGRASSRSFPLKGDEFQFNGYFVKRESISRLLVKKTSESVKTHAAEENRKPRQGFIAIYVSPSDILSYDKYATDITKDAMAMGREKIAAQASPTGSTRKLAPSSEKRKVFVVHGHDDLAKTTVARFVEKLGFDAIVLHEQPSSGRTIIEKIEMFTDVGFAIVIYSPDDLGAKAASEPQLQPRARQNVVFEHGFLVAKLGRGSVAALVKGDLEKPSDIDGIVYTVFDERGGWMLAVCKEMKNAGYAADMNLLS